MYVTPVGRGAVHLQKTRRLPGLGKAVYRSPGRRARPGSGACRPDTDTVPLASMTLIVRAEAA